MCNFLHIARVEVEHSGFQRICFLDYDDPFIPAQGLPLAPPLMALAPEADEQV
jgi:hypothetical protein